MNKKLTILMGAIVALAMIFAPMGMAKKNKTGKAGKSHVGHLYLVEKDPSTWEIVEGGAWGKMTYKVKKDKFDFVFNGHDLVPGEDYTLIYYPDPWPGTGLVCFGSCIANGGGNVHIQGSVDWDFRLASDENSPGAKIWLVLTDNVDCDATKMVGWNPTEYLFEFDVIFGEE